MAVGDIWYRYEDVQYAAPVDEYGDSRPGEGRLAVELRKFQIVRETPKGVWVAPYFEFMKHLSEEEKFVRNNSVKKHAYPTIEEAKKGFIARKNAQLRILNAGVRRAEKALRVIEQISTPLEMVQ
jgi:hypothetical protein